MTGYKSKRAMAQDKLDDDDDTQVYQRPWAGLTRQEFNECVDGVMYLESGGPGYGPAPKEKLIIGYVNKPEQPAQIEVCCVVGGSPTQGEEHMKEEWLFPNAIVPVDVETTSELIAEIKRLIDVIGGMALAQPAQEPWRESASDYERGFIDGAQKQAQSSVDKAVNRMAQRPWVGLTEWEREAIAHACGAMGAEWLVFVEAVEKSLKEKNR